MLKFFIIAQVRDSPHSLTVVQPIRVVYRLSVPRLSWLMLVAQYQLAILLRDSERADSGLVFGCLNVRSIGNKFDDLLDVRREQLINALFLCKPRTV